MSMLKPLDKNAILDALDIDIEQVDVSEWNGSVFVKGMTGRERDQFESSIIDNPGKNVRVRMMNSGVNRY